MFLYIIFSNNMKILFLHELDSRKLVSDGVAVYIRALQKGLTDNGDETRLVSFDEICGLKRLLKYRLPAMFLYKIKSDWTTCWIYFIRARIIGKMAKEFIDEFDIVHVHDPLLFNEIYERYPSTRPRIVMTIHGIRSYDNMKKKLYSENSAPHIWFKKQEVLALKRSHNTIFVSEYLKSHVSDKLSIDLSKVYVIYNGIDTDFSPKETDILKLKENYGITPDETVIGTIGRMSSQKGPDIFVSVAEKLLKELSNIRFIMVGDGEMKHDIEGLVKSRGISDKFILTGLRSDKFEHIGLFDISLFPSRWEGLSFSLLETLSLGVPVVASSAHREAIRNSIDGIIVFGNDIDAYCNAISLLIKDKSYRKKMSESARRRSHDFSSVMMVRKHLDIYTKMGSGSGFNT